MPPLRHNHHTVVHESFFLFAQSLHPIPSPTLTDILLSIYASVSISLLSSICSLDSTYERNHMVLPFSDWLISLSVMFSSMCMYTQVHVLPSHSSPMSWQSLSSNSHSSTKPSWTAPAPAVLTPEFLWHFINCITFHSMGTLWCTYYSPPERPLGCFWFFFFKVSPPTHPGLDFILHFVDLSFFLSLFLKHLYFLNILKKTKNEIQEELLC